MGQEISISNISKISGLTAEEILDKLSKSLKTNVSEPTLFWAGACTIGTALTLPSAAKYIVAVTGSVEFPYASAQLKLLLPITLTPNSTVKFSTETYPSGTNTEYRILDTSVISLSANGTIITSHFEWKQVSGATVYNSSGIVYISAYA